MGINMGKNIAQAINVVKFYVGVGWKSTGGGAKGWKGALNRRKGTDLDVWAVGFNFDGDSVAVAWFDDQDPFEDGSLLVSDDSTTGREPGDDEYVTADLSRVPNFIQSIIFGVSAFKEGVSFATVSSVAYRIVDEATKVELGKDMLPVDARQNAVVLCEVFRSGVGLPWEFSAIKSLETARTRQEIIRIAKLHARTS